MGRRYLIFTVAKCNEAKYISIRVWFVKTEKLNTVCKEYKCTLLIFNCLLQCAVQTSHSDPKSHSKWYRVLILGGGVYDDWGVKLRICISFFWVLDCYNLQTVQPWFIMIYKTQYIYILYIPLKRSMTLAVHLKTQKNRAKCKVSWCFL